MTRPSKKAAKKASVDAVLNVMAQEQEADVLARFGQKGYQLWHQAPRRQRLATPAVVGSTKGTSGDIIAIAFNLAGETITETDFDVVGGAASTIAAAAAASLIRGKPLDEAVRIDDQAIIASLGTFPEDARPSAFLAVSAVRDAIHRWMIQGGQAEQQLGDDVRARFGEKGFRIWSEAANRPQLDAPDAIGTLTGSCGDTITIALGLEGETIVATDFDTDGCASSLIAAATTASLAQGKTLDEAVDIDAQAVVDAVGEFPEGDRHCAHLAASALREAIHEWMVEHTTRNGTKDGNAAS